MYGVQPVVEWNKKELDLDVIYELVLACSAKQSLYVIIDGGLNALNAMKEDDIRSKEDGWYLSKADRLPDSHANWINAESFLEIFRSLGIDKQWFNQ